jgi:hypothetical protein
MHSVTCSKPCAMRSNAESRPLEAGTGSPTSGPRRLQACRAGVPAGSPGLRKMPSGRRFPRHRFSTYRQPRIRNPPSGGQRCLRDLTTARGRRGVGAHRPELGGTSRRRSGCGPRRTEAPSKSESSPRRRARTETAPHAAPVRLPHQSRASDARPEPASTSAGRPRDDGAAIVRARDSRAGCRTTEPGTTT